MTNRNQNDQDEIRHIHDPNLDQEADPPVIELKKLDNVGNLNQHNYDLKIKELELIAEKQRRYVPVGIILIILVSFFVSILVDLLFVKNQAGSFLVTEYYFKILPIVMLILGINISFTLK